MTEHEDRTHRDCDVVRRRVKAWLDGELVPREMKAIDAHVSSCSACGELASEYERISSTLREAVGEVPPPPIVAVLRGLETTRREKTTTLRVLKGVAAAAALVLMTTIGFLAVPHRGDAFQDEVAQQQTRHDEVMEIVFIDPAWGGDY